MGSSLPKTPPTAAGGTKPGTPGPKKGKVPPTPSTKIIPVFLDVETAKTLLTALALALSGPINKKKKGKKGTGKGPKGPVAKGPKAPGGGKKKTP